MQGQKVWRIQKASQWGLPSQTALAKQDTSAKPCHPIKIIERFPAQLFSLRVIALVCAISGLDTLAPHGYISFQMQAGS